jgi:hypothetical protein
MDCNEILIDELGRDIEDESSESENEEKDSSEDEIEVFS